MKRPNLRTPNDITTLEGYVASVDPDVTPLSHILYPYDIRPFEIGCALCGQAHMEGRIVALVGGDITNIGHICGKKFGDKYAEALAAYHETMDRPILVQRMTEGFSKINSLQLQLLALKNRLVDLKEREVRFANLFPDAYRELRRRAVDNKADIYESVERTKAEVDDLLAANPYQPRESLQIKEVYRGSIAGHRFLATDWSTEHGILRLFTEVDRFSELSDRSLPTKSMARWAIWLEEFDTNVELAKGAIVEGDRFFTEQNFKLFSLLPGPDAARAKLQLLSLKDLDARQITSTVLQIQPHKPLGTIKAKRTEPQLTNRQLRRMTGDKKARW